MLKYHNHPVNGPTKCRVGLGETVRGCPFGSLETEHYATIEEAQIAFEKKASQAHGATSTITEVRGNISRATDLCESAMATNSNIEKISEELEEKPSKEKPTVLRKKSAQEIKKILEEWRLGLEGLYPGAVITSNNDSGNAAASDLIATYTDGSQVLIESKFGAATNAAAGIDRITKILGTNAFSYSPQERKALAGLYISEGSEAVKEEVSKNILEYSETFNKQEHNIDSSAVFDLIKSSGAEGNSNESEDYKVYSFSESRGVGVIKEIPLNLRRSTEWTVKAEPSIQEDSSRLNYIFTSKDGTKTIRLTYNNKNSNKIKDANGNTVRIPSKMFTGSGSYNVWYSEN